MTRRPALLVLASEADGAARGFVARQAGRGAVLLTPRDLSRPGWHFRHGDPASTTLAAGDRQIRAGEIVGVLTRLAGVTGPDLPHIAREDRAYVAAEMTAFLLALLSSLAIRVANRPTPQCLCGPAWSAGKWRLIARGLGLEADPARQRATLEAAGEADEAERGATVTVIGGDCIDAPDPALGAAAQAIAHAAGADLLAVEFAHAGPNAAMLRARLVPDLGSPGADHAVMGLFGLQAA